MREELVKLIASRPELLIDLNANIRKLLKFVDYLIANGVTIPVRCDACKLGEMCSIREAMACTTPDGYCWRGERRADA